MRGRTTDPNNKVASDVETDPALRYSAIWRHGTNIFNLFYTPRFLFSDTAGHANQLETMQGGGAALGFYQGKTAFQIGTVGQYGTIAASSLIIPERWQGQGAPKTYYSLPADQSVKLTYVASYSNASLVQQLSRRWQLTINAQYGVFGGPDEESRKQLPLVWGPTGEVKIEHNLTHWTDIDVTAGVHYSETKVATTPTVTVSSSRDLESGQFYRHEITDLILQPKPALVGYGELRVRHKYTRTTTIEAAVGAAVAHQAFPDTYKNAPPPGEPANPYQNRADAIPYPTGEVLAVYGKEQEHGKVQLVAVARVVPWFDPFAGVNEERSEFAVAGNFIWGKNAIRGQMSFYHVLPTSSTPGDYTLAIGELAYERRINKYVGFDFGVRFGWQTFDEVDVGAASRTVTPSNGAGVATPGAVSITRDTTEVDSNHRSLIEGIGFLGISWSPTPLKL